MGERQTEDLKVPGSIPGHGNILHVLIVITSAIWLKFSRDIILSISRDSSVGRASDWRSEGSSFVSSLQLRFYIYIILIFNIQLVLIRLMISVMEFYKLKLVLWLEGGWVVKSCWVQMEIQKMCFQHLVIEDKKSTQKSKMSVQHHFMD